MTEKRKEQALDWMYFLLDEGLRQWFYNNQQVMKILPQLQKNVAKGLTSPAAAADNLLEILNKKR